MEYSGKIQAKMRILRVKRFIDQWNEKIEAGCNPLEKMIAGNRFNDDTATQSKFKT
jgi:hypothetical protein